MKQFHYFVSFVVTHYSLTFIQKHITMKNIESIVSYESHLLSFHTFFPLVKERERSVCTIYKPKIKKNKNENDKTQPNPILGGPRRHLYNVVSVGKVDFPICKHQCTSNFLSTSLALKFSYTHRKHDHITTAEHVSPDLMSLGVSLLF